MYVTIDGKCDEDAIGKEKSDDYFILKNILKSIAQSAIIILTYLEKFF